MLPTLSGEVVNYKGDDVNIPYAYAVYIGSRQDTCVDAVLNSIQKRHKINSYLLTCTSFRRLISSE